MATINVADAQVVKDGVLLTGLEAALHILKNNSIHITTGPFAKTRLWDRTSEDLKRHKYFLSRSGRKREKKRKAGQKWRKRQRKTDSFTRRDPKVYFAEKEFDRIKAAEREIAEVMSRPSTDPDQAPKRLTVTTVLLLVWKWGRRNGRRVQLFLTGIDEEKLGRRGFLTGGIEPGRTMEEVVPAELQEEANLKAKIPESIVPFHEKNVARGGEKPYFMKGVDVPNPTGMLHAGKELEAGSLKWQTGTEIDEEIMNGVFLRDHAEFWNVWNDIQVQNSVKKEAASV